MIKEEYPENDNGVTFRLNIIFFKNGRNPVYECPETQDLLEIIMELAESHTG